MPMPMRLAAQNANAHKLLRAGVIGNFEVSLLLYHSAFLLFKFIGWGPYPFSQQNTPERIISLFQ